MLLFLCAHLLNAQEMSVNIFYHDQTDLTAITRGTEKFDQNGNRCALIKLETTVKNFTFEVGVLGVVAVVEQPAETWIYVPYGIRKLSIKHPEYGMIRNYTLPCSIDMGCTYILKLNMPEREADMGLYDPAKKQKVRLQVYPADASVDINGMSIMLDERGVCEQVFAFGRYQIMASAPKYHPSKQRMEIKDSTSVLNVNIRLKQAFGWLKISGDRDETLYIDDKPYSYAPGTPIEMMSGHYKVRMEKPMYQPYEGTIEIKDSVVLDLAPAFVENFRELTLKVYDQAEIWVDGAKVGNGSWTGRLEYGMHRLECRKESHRTTVLNVNITPQTLGPILLDTPEPIVGYIDVSSTPLGAEVYVDDKLVGHTPTKVSALVGQRKVTVKRKGYNTETITVDVKESETSRVEAKLSNIVLVTISSVPKSDLYIDGKYIGKTPIRKSLLSGEHTVKLEEDNYLTLEEKILVDEKNASFSFKMKKLLYSKNAIVAGVNAMTGFSDVSVGGYVGGYFYNFYLEGFMQKGLVASESIYWNSQLAETLPLEYTYSPLYLGTKLGYGIIIGAMWRITPAVGIELIRLKGMPVDGIIRDYDPSACSAVAAIGSVKASVALLPCLELSITPEYHCSVSKSELYKAIYDVSPSVAKMSEGVKFNVGIGLFF